MLEEHCDITEREQLVAQHLLRDLTIVDIAQQLQISPYTVRSHIHELNGKTQTETTHELVRWARAHEICCCD